MTKVKICGITNLEDALLSAKFGADALGFNFYPQSPRYILPEKAREIVEQLPKEVLKVGVFVNDSLDKIIEIAETAKLDAIQLHGEETPEFVREIKAKTNLEIIKAFRVSPEFKAEDVLKYEVDAVLLDAYSPKEHGGTGETFDWEVAKNVQKIFPKMYLAGGLSEENIAEAIVEVKPFAIDACSCLEIEKGKKDLEKVERFIFEIKNGLDEQLVVHRVFVKKYFQFLETDYGFTLRKVKTNFNSSSIRYESNVVFVEPWYFLSQYDYDVSFGLLKDSQRFNIGDLVASGYEWNLSKDFNFDELSQTEIVEKNVSGFADFLRQNGENVLKGDVKTFNQLEKNRDERSRAYSEKIQTEHLRKQAELAWQKRNFLAVVENYKIIRNLLTPSEIKKLEYSEKHLSNE